MKALGQGLMRSTVRWLEVTLSEIQSISEKENLGKLANRVESQRMKRREGLAALRHFIIGSR